MSKESLSIKRKSKYSLQNNYGLPHYTLIEEILNAITHGLGVVLAISAMILLPIYTPINKASLFCIITYTSTLFVLYIVSTLYHALKISTAKRVFRVLDHCSIFLLIAGTYTPITILIIGGLYGWTLFSVVWAMALIGILFNCIDLKKYSRFSMVCYIVMGWAVVFAFKPLLNSINTYQFKLLLIGGITYTIGAVIYGLGKKIKYMHSLWHLFVLAGSILHFLMVFDSLKNI